MDSELIPAVQRQRFEFTQQSESAYGRWPGICLDELEQFLAAHPGSRLSERGFAFSAFVEMPDGRFFEFKRTRYFETDQPNVTAVKHNEAASNG
jgi:hypothetical protein